MNREEIETWLDREFDTSYPPTQMSELAEALMPLLARVWDEGRLIGYNETGGDTTNPYGEPL